MPKEKERERVKEQLKQPTWHVTESGHQGGAVQATEASWGSLDKASAP